MIVKCEATGRGKKNGTFGLKLTLSFEKWKEKLWYLCSALAKTYHHTLFVFADEKKKTKKIDSELNPFWNEVILFLINSWSFLRQNACKIVKSISTVVDIG